MQEFEVGSYVWFVRGDRPGVRHYLVVEEIVKKSIDGVTRDYLFETVSSGKVGRVESRQLIGDYFIKREDAYDFMLTQAGTAINAMMDKATYPKPEPVAETVLSPAVDQQFQGQDDIEEETIVELPDGTKARLKGGIPK